MAFQLTQIINRVLGVQLRDRDGNLFTDQNQLPVGSQIRSTYKERAYATTSPLPANGSVTTPTFEVAAFKKMTGTVTANQTGVLHIEHSHDGLDWRRVGESVELTGSGTQSLGFDFTLYEGFVRLVYVNGGTAQTTFKLTGYLLAN